MKRVYFSDVHMGKRVPLKGKKYHPHNYVWLDCNGKKQAFKDFLDFLIKRKDVGEVIMAGDILDNWVVPIDVMPPTFEEILADTTVTKDDDGNSQPTNADIVASLRKLSDKKGVEVRYLPGNHDMGIDKATIKKFFPNMMFGGNHEYGLQYICDDIIVEHGTSQAMFNGPDSESDPITKIPIGYFFSRIAATVAAKGENLISVSDVIKGLLGQGGDIAQKAFNTVVDAAGLKRDDKIVIGPHPIFDPDGDGYITVGEVRVRYWDIYSRYQKAYNEHRRPLSPVVGASVDASNVRLMVDPLNKEHGTRIVVLGHTHDEMHQYYPANSNSIYANCGSWCNKSDAMNPRSGFFVETLSDNGKVEVTLKYWDAQNNKPTESGNTLLYPRPQDALGNYI